MAKLSAKEKYEKLYSKKIELMEKIEKMKAEMTKIDENLEYAEFLAWKEDKKAKSKVVVITETAADSASDNAIITSAF